VVGAWTGRTETEGLKWGWRRELGSWFQRQGEAYRKEWSVIRGEDDVGDRQIGLHCAYAWHPLPLPLVMSVQILRECSSYAVAQIFCACRELARYVLLSVDDGRRYSVYKRVDAQLQELEQHRQQRAHAKQTNNRSPAAARSVSCANVIMPSCRIILSCVCASLFTGIYWPSSSHV